MQTYILMFEIQLFRGNVIHCSSTLCWLKSNSSYMNLSVEITFQPEYVLTYHKLWICIQPSICTICNLQQSTVICHDEFVAVIQTVIIYIFLISLVKYSLTRVFTVSVHNHKFKEILKRNRQFACITCLYYFLLIYLS